MKRVFLTLTVLLALALAACSSQQDASIQASNVWSRESPAMAQAGAVFMTLENSGKEGDALIGGTTDICDVVELHESIMENDVMQMRPVEGGKIEIPAGGSVELKPGGLHVMLIGLNQELQPGTTFTLELQFEKAGKMQIEVEVKDAGEMGMGG